MARFFFAEEMLKVKGKDLEGARCLVSGSGNVAIYAIEKLQHLGAQVVACADSTGVIFDQKGIDLTVLKQIKEVDRQRIHVYVDSHPGSEYMEGGNIWDIPCDVALPCATQNELDAKAARKLIANGCIAISEGANMPCTPEAVDLFLEGGIAYGPGKAANAGGVATSALEMQQNASRDAWSFEYSEKRLREIMTNIHRDCYNISEEFNCKANYVVGANIASFRKVADAMLAFGII